AMTRSRASVQQHYKMSSSGFGWTLAASTRATAQSSRKLSTPCSGGMRRALFATSSCKISPRRTMAMEPKILYFGA
ncbi:hypothetical protein diail_3195, partial [Diaporthe ilicicola]